MEDTTAPQNAVPFDNIRIVLRIVLITLMFTAFISVKYLLIFLTIIIVIGVLSYLAIRLKDAILPTLQAYRNGEKYSTLLESGSIEDFRNFDFDA